jgi:isopropylmalate/homocitrate/citramalate synthase
VLGRGNFTRESGIGIQYVMHDPLVMFGTHPAFTGRSGEVVLGKKSGKASITYKLDELGLGEATDEQNTEILDLVKQASIIKKRDILTDDEFKAIASSVLSRAGA